MLKQFLSLKDSELLRITKDLATKERALTVSLIEHLQEIHKRRLFADLGYSSLYDYVRKELGYSDAEAGVRVSSMRLIEDLPQAKEELRKGNISLTTLSMTASSLRRQDKMLEEKLSIEEKEKILYKVMGKSTRETEVILKELEISTFKEKSITPPLTTTLNQKIVVNIRVIKKILELKKIKGNYSDSELLELLLDQELTRIEEETKKVVEKESKKEGEVAATSIPANNNTRYISKKVKEAVRKRAQNRCEFVNPSTGKRCEEVHGLEFDHCMPYSWSGKSDGDNITLKCRSHNVRAAIKSLGMAKMDPYINPPATPARK